MSEKTKACIDCKRLIEITASKCSICQAYQDKYRRILASAGPALAVISLVTIALNIIVDFFEVKRADVRAVIVDAGINGDDSEFYFMISNIGNAPAGISNVSIESKSLFSERHGTTLLNTALDKRVLEPGETKLITVSDTYRAPEPISRIKQMAYKAATGTPYEKNCYLSVEYVQLDSIGYDTHTSFPCITRDDLREILQKKG